MKKGNRVQQSYAQLASLKVYKVIKFEKSDDAILIK